MNQKEAKRQLGTAIRARVPVVAIQSWEEDRVLRAIQDLAAEPVTGSTGNVIVESRRVFRWTLTSGIERLGKLPTDYEPEFDPGVPRFEPKDAVGDYFNYVSAAEVRARIDNGDGRQSLMEALRERASILVMCDVHRHIGERAGEDGIIFMRALRNAISGLRATSSVIVLLGTHFDDLGDAARDIYSMKWPLPDVAEMADLVRLAAGKVAVSVDLNGGTEVVARALAGLSQNEARQCLGIAIIECQELSLATVPYITALKAAILERAQGIKLIPPRKTLDDIGGLDVLKADMLRLPKMLTEAARKRHIKPPRGILLAGPPGTGKTLSAQVLGGGSMPILDWKIGTTKSKWVGETEANVARVLDTADAIDHCVLVVDEAEKELAAGGNEDTANSTMAALSLILSWMQDKESNVIVAFTANHPERLATELVSRFDKQYFVGYPNRDACGQIVSIHLRQREIELTEAEVDILGDLAHKQGLMGREIEDAINEANRMSFDDDVPLDRAYVEMAMRLMKPASERNKAEIAAMIDHCEGSYIAASTDELPRRGRVQQDMKLDFDIDS